MPEWMPSAAQACSNPFATNNSPSPIANMPVHSTTMSEYQNLSSDVIIDGVNMNTSIVNMSVHLRMVPRHQNCSSDATSDSAIIPGPMNQVFFTSHTQTLPLEGNLESTMDYHLSMCNQKLRVCSLEHKTTFNPQLASCRALLTVPCTVILAMGVVSMLLSLSVGTKCITLIIQVDNASTSSKVLQEHQITCSDTPNGMVDHQTLVHSFCAYILHPSWQCSAHC